MTDWFGRFGKYWGSSSTPQPPTDAQAAAGFSFLGTNKPPAQLHDACFQWLDQKDNFLFSDLASCYVALNGLVAEGSPGALGPLLAAELAKLQNAINALGNSTSSADAANNVALQLAAYQKLLRTMPLFTTGLVSSALNANWTAPASCLVQIEANGSGAAGGSTYVGLPGGGGGAASRARMWCYLNPGDTINIFHPVPGAEVPQEGAQGLDGAATVVNISTSNAPGASATIGGGFGGHSQANGDLAPGGLGGTTTYTGLNKMFFGWWSPGEDGADGYSGGHGGGGGRSGTDGGKNGRAFGSGGGGGYLQKGTDINVG